MNQYLLTYHLGGQFYSEIVNAQGIAAALGNSTITGARNFKAYQITPEGVYPVYLTGCITSMVVNVNDYNGVPVDSATFFELAR